MKTKHIILALGLAAAAFFANFANAAADATAASGTPEAVLEKYERYKAEPPATAKATMQWRTANAEWLAANVAAAPQVPAHIATWLVSNWLHTVNDSAAPAWTAGASLAKTYSMAIFISRFATADDIAALPASPYYAGNVYMAAKRLGNASVAGNYFESIAGKGCTNGSYIRWFREKLKKAPVASRLTLVNIELNGLVGAGNSPAVQKWDEELKRHRDTYSK